MKSYINKLWLAAMPLAFVACQNEEVVAENTLPAQSGKPIQTLSGVMGEGEMSSRAQIVLGNEDVESEIFFWNDGDQFTVYRQAEFPSDASVEVPNTATFTISENYSESNPAVAAEFQTTSTNLRSGDAVTAVYPLVDAATTPVNNGKIKVEIPYSLTLWNERIASEWNNYFKNNMYMVATATLTPNNNQLSFQHLTALLRVAYTNNTGEAQRINEVALFGRVSFKTSTNINLQTGKASGGFNPTQLNIVCRNNLTVQDGETVDFYFLTFEDTWVPSDSYVAVKINANGKEIKSDPLSMDVIGEHNDGVKRFEAGKRYKFNMNHKGDALLWGNTEMENPEGTITNLELIKAIEMNHGFTFNRNDDGFVDIGEPANYNFISNCTKLDLSNCGLTSLEGIEFFTNLGILDCSNNQLETMDLSQNENLGTLDCSNNKLTALDLNGTKVSTLNCSNNQLTDLDMSYKEGEGMINLVCYGNHLSSLDMSKLRYLDAPNLKLLCGQQTDAEGQPQEMHLTIRLEENSYGVSQLPLWAKFCNAPENENVVVEGYSPVVGGGSAGNLTDGGDF